MGLPTTSPDAVIRSAITRKKQSKRHALSLRRLNPLCHLQKPTGPSLSVGE